MRRRDRQCGCWCEAINDISDETEYGFDESGTDETNATKPTKDTK